MMRDENEPPRGLKEIAAVLRRLADEVRGMDEALDGEFGIWGEESYGESPTADRLIKIADEELEAGE